MGAQASQQKLMYQASVLKLEILVQQSQDYLRDRSEFWIHSGTDLTKYKFYFLLQKILPTLG